MKKNAPTKVYDFNDIRKFLEKPGQAGNDVLESFDALVDAAIIFSPLFLGPQCLLLLNVLDVKDRIINIGKVVYNGIIKHVQPDYNTRVEQLKAAYALISTTAYLELLPEAIPENVVRILKKETPQLKDILEKNIGTPENVDRSLEITDYFADHAISFAEVKNHILERYQEASNCFIKLIDKVSEGTAEKEKKELNAAKRRVKDLPQKAIENYEKHYIELAIEFNDFALFAQIDILKRIDSISSDNKKAIEKLAGEMDKIDVGLKKLRDFINSIPTNYSEIRVQKIVDDLKATYTTILQKPIIDQSEIKDDDETTSLVFPKIIDAFIPQSYKSLTYDDGDIKLEDNHVWDSLPEQRDLDNYFIKYLYSPDSVEYPLLILGQPGSGKSLLTKVLSAQLMSDSYTVIRIPLRDVNANEKIGKLVVNQINNVIDRNASIEGYADFAEHFSEKPLIIILDGYDELLQAKGRVFYEYLENIREFQEQQKYLNRPVRVIVTSRITLINKTQIPLHTSVLRLLEFDREKQAKWISIWNKTNANFFEKKGISPFKLPTKIKGENNSILELAEQPLLLLMLAIYDSDSNELAKNKNIKRTELYDNLIRRFIRRERQRYVEDFKNIDHEAKEKIIDDEVKRLGIVAIGMYNRREVVIRSEQLEADLNLFQAHRDDGSPQMYTLKESESVLGGFFFIHQSKAKDLEANSANIDSAYEFLHNTFGEFLAADFILRNTIDTVVKAHTTKTLNLPLDNIIEHDWYYCLMFVPLYSRPVIIEMLREHLERSLKNNIINNKQHDLLSIEDFITNLEFIVKHELKMVLNKRELPKVMIQDNLFDSDISLIGYLSTYSMNLMILMSALSQNGYKLDETDYYQKNNRTRDNHPWDELVSLWKAWFLQSDLIGLSAIIKANRITDTEVLIKCNDRFESTPFEQPIDVLLCVSHALGDSFITGLAGLYTDHFYEITGYDDTSACNLFSHLAPSVCLSYLVRTLTRQIQPLQTIEDIIKNPDKIKCINEILNKIVLTIKHEVRGNDLDLGTYYLVFNAITYCLSHKLVYFKERKKYKDTLRYLGQRTNWPSYEEEKHRKFISHYEWRNIHTFKMPIMTAQDYRELYETNSYLNRHSYIIQDFTIDSPLNNADKEFCEYYFKLLIRSKAKQEVQFLVKTIDLKNMPILIETNPELVFHFLDALLISKEQLHSDTMEIISIISKQSLDRIQREDFILLSVETVIDILSVARRIEYRNFIDSLISSSQEQDYNLFSDERYYSIGSIIKLIELLPDNNIVNYIPKIKLLLEESLYSEKLLLVAGVDDLFNYLKILRYIYKSGSKDEEIVSRVVRCLFLLTTFISEHIDLTILTICQIYVLHSCAELAKNKTLMDKIKIVMNMDDKEQKE